LLCDHDKAQAPNVCPLIPPLPASIAPRRDQSLRLVVPYCRNRQPGALRQCSDCQAFRNSHQILKKYLDLKLGLEITVSRSKSKVEKETL
jgi:hypothetical protein